jgi:long-chain acyl-CoA synthetase
MTRRWAALYPKGARAELGDPPFKTLGELPRLLAKEFRNQIAFTTVMPNGMSGDLTYAQADSLSDAFAAYLREEIKLKPGDRVALQMPNGLAFPIAAFGVMKAGCVLVNVNPLYTASEMGYQFADAKPQALIIINMFTDKLPRALDDYHIPHIILVRAAEFFPLHLKLLIGFVQRFIKWQIPNCKMRTLSFSRALRLGKKHLGRGIMVQNYVSQMNGSELACLQYTGGTTGIAKGAMLSHKNLIMNMIQSIEMVGSSIERGKEVLLTVLPLYHIFAFTMNFIGFFSLGARNILIPNPRPLDNLREAFRRYAITWIGGVNTLFNGLNNCQWFADNPPRSLKYGVAGGMALQGAVAERWRKITGVPIIEGYGLTETSPIVTFNPLQALKEGSIGIPIPSTDVRCIDGSGHEVALNEPGELAVKGPQVMIGYWNRPQETANVLKDGWLLTGDIAKMDGQGYVYIVDRKKDMILHSGFNIYPNEVEDCLVKHPQIIEAAVIGVPDGAAGEAVKAFIVRRDENLTVDEVRAFCKERLTPYKVPKYVEFRNELPKSNVGKILRKELRALYFLK